MISLQYNLSSKENYEFSLTIQIWSNVTQSKKAANDFAARCARNGIKKVAKDFGDEADRKIARE